MKAREGAASTRQRAGRARKGSAKGKAAETRPALLDDQSERCSFPTSGGHRSYMSRLPRTVHDISLRMVTLSGLADHLLP
jgi:hypothetical protein